jgi:hypothetical protein
MLDKRSLASSLSARGLRSLTKIIVEGLVSGRPGDNDREIVLRSYWSRSQEVSSGHLLAKTPVKLQKKTLPIPTRAADIAPDKHW